MDNIITLIVIIIAIVSAVSKIKAKQKPKSDATPATGSELGTKLKAFFADIQQRLEEQTPKGPSGASRWDTLLNADKAKDPLVHSYELSLEDIELEEEKKPVAPVKKPPTRPARVHHKPVEKRPVGHRTEQCVPELLPANETPCPAFLRRAVVWSEILGPPVALRDSSRDR
jgi:hypothetical protein